MERDAYEFLTTVSVDELVSLGAMNRNRRHGYLLQGENVEALMQLMRDRGVATLTSVEHNWHLSTDETYNNPRAREFKSGFVRPECRGDVFLDQNQHINPYFHRATRPRA